MSAPDLDKPSDAPATSPDRASPTLPPPALAPVAPPSPEVAPALLDPNPPHPHRAT